MGSSIDSVLVSHVVITVFDVTPTATRYGRRMDAPVTETPGTERPVSEIDEQGVVASLHHPARRPRALAVLAHGAGGNRDAPILVAVAGELARRGLIVARIDLPYRQQRPKGPPSPSRAAADREGIVAACTLLRGRASAGHPGLPLIVGGHSYGGRQASMCVADDPSLADGLLLTSYPLHPPGKPDRLRTEHLPRIVTPTVIVHGRSDAFGTSGELAAAAALFAGPVHVVEVDKADHSLKPARSGVAGLTADAVDAYLL